MTTPSYKQFAESYVQYLKETNFSCDGQNKVGIAQYEAERDPYMEGYYTAKLRKKVAEAAEEGLETAWRRVRERAKAEIREQPYGSPYHYLMFLTSKEGERWWSGGSPPPPSSSTVRSPPRRPKIVKKKPKKPTLPRAAQPTEKNPPLLPRRSEQVFVNGRLCVLDRKGTRSVKGVDVPEFGLAEVRRRRVVSRAPAPPPKKIFHDPEKKPRHRGRRHHHHVEESPPPDVLNPILGVASECDIEISFKTHQEDNPEPTTQTIIEEEETVYRTAVTATHDEEWQRLTRHNLTLLTDTTGSSTPILRELASVDGGWSVGTAPPVDFEKMILSKTEELTKREHTARDSIESEWHHDTILMRKNISDVQNFEEIEETWRRSIEMSGMMYYTTTMQIFEGCTREVVENSHCVGVENIVRDLDINIQASRVVMVAQVTAEAEAGRYQQTISESLERLELEERFKRGLLAEEDDMFPDITVTGSRSGSLTFVEDIAEMQQRYDVEKEEATTWVILVEKCRRRWILSGFEGFHSVLRSVYHHGAVVQDLSTVCCDAKKKFYDLSACSVAEDIDRSVISTNYATDLTTLTDSTEPKFQTSPRRSIAAETILAIEETSQRQIIEKDWLRGHGVIELELGRSTVTKKVRFEKGEEEEEESPLEASDDEAMVVVEEEDDEDEEIDFEIGSSEEEEEEEEK